MRDIGKNIRAARLRRGMTQDELAERLHVSRQTVSNYETGRSRPDVEMLLSMAEQLEEDVQVLLYGEPLRPERRREMRLLLAEGAALLVLGAGVFLLGRWAERLVKRMGVASLMYLTRFVALPMLCMLLGWVLLRACGTFLGARPLARRWAKPLRRAVLACLILWLGLESPVLVTALYQAGCLLFCGPEASLDLNIAPPQWWRRAWLWVQVHVSGCLPVIFVLFGAALWSTRPEQREKAP